MTDLRFSCTCGKTQWRLKNASPKSASRLSCYCKDCQAFVHHLDNANLLDANGGTSLNQCKPDDVVIDAGAENMAPLQLSPKGIYRWHTTCCNTPVANTLGNPGVPFVSLLLASADGDISATLGDRNAQVNVKGATGPDAPTANIGLSRMMRKFITRAVRSRLNGSWRKNPFFNEDRSPIARPIVLTKAQREDATPS